MGELRWILFERLKNKKRADQLKFSSQSALYVCTFNYDLLTNYYIDNALLLFRSKMNKENKPSIPAMAISPHSESVGILDVQFA